MKFWNIISEGNFIRQVQGVITVQVYMIVIRDRIVGCNFKIGFLKEFARTFKEGIFGDIILNNVYKTNFKEDL